MAFKVIYKATLKLHDLFNTDYVYMLLIAGGIIFLKYRVEFSEQIFVIPWLLIIGLTLITVFLNTFVMKFCISFIQTQEISLRQTLKSNLAKIIGGGFSQILVLRNVQNEFSANIIKKWFYLLSFQVVASIPFLLGCSLEKNSGLVVTVIRLVWFIFVLFSCLNLFFCNLQNDFQKSKFILTLLISLIAQITASFCLLLCLPNISATFLPQIDFGFIVSLAVPIPGGIVVREWIFILLLGSKFSISSILTASIFFRLIQTLVEYFLALLIYCLDFLKTKNWFLSESDK